MRSVLLPVLALSLAVPSVARASEAQDDISQMAERLNDPATQSALAGGLSAMLGALMNMRVDGIAKALEPMNGGKKLKMKGNTIGEIASRRDPHFQQKLQGSSKMAIGGLGAMASALAVMMPQLEEAMGKMGDAMDHAKDQMPHSN